jgi:hypothetical protein
MFFKGRQAQKPNVRPSLSCDLPVPAVDVLSWSTHAYARFNSIASRPPIFRTYPIGIDRIDSAVLGGVATLTASSGRTIQRHPSLLPELFKLLPFYYLLLCGILRCCAG